MAGAAFIAYAMYVESTRCRICCMKYNHHKLNCPNSERYSSKPVIRMTKNHEVWVTCKDCLVCFDAREHGYTCPYCHTDNK